MANEIKYLHDATGATIYALVFKQDGTVWSVAAGAWVAFAVADWANYVIALTETPSGSYRYLGSFPASQSFGWFELVIYGRGGAAAAISDLALRREQVWWTGGYLQPGP